MANKTYKEKLLDPRWQRRRLQILSRSDFACEGLGCGSKTETLHVHHLDYLPNAEPWEYPDDYLMALCESCHATISECRPVYEKGIIKNYRLKLRDHFILRCTADVFEKYSNLNDLFFLLWEGNEKEVLSLLANYSNKNIPIEFLKPIENAEPHTQGLDGQR